MGAVGTRDCSLHLMGGYRDVRIMIFKEPRVTSYSEGNSDGIWKERSSDQAVKQWTRLPSGTVDSPCFQNSTRQGLTNLI